MEDQLYEQKYLKYKKKYLDLKNTQDQEGGINLTGFHYIFYDSKLLDENIEKMKKYKDENPNLNFFKDTIKSVFNPYKNYNEFSQKLKCNIDPTKKECENIVKQSSYLQSLSKIISGSNEKQYNMNDSITSLKSISKILWSSVYLTNNNKKLRSLIKDNYFFNNRNVDENQYLKALEKIVCPDSIDLPYFLRGTIDEFNNKIKNSEGTAINILKLLKIYSGMNFDSYLIIDAKARGNQFIYNKKFDEKSLEINNTQQTEGQAFRNANNISLNTSNNSLSIMDQIWRWEILNWKMNAVATVAGTSTQGSSMPDFPGVDIQC